MEMILKTKQVSEELGVNPSTIQRWVKFFNLPCQRNEHGHYLFNEKHIEELRKIKDQLSEGLAMTDVQIDIPKKEAVKTKEFTLNNEIEKRLDKLIMRIDNMERRLETKADEVVSAQLLQHRLEIDDLVKKINSLENTLLEMQEKQTFQMQDYHSDFMLEKPKPVKRSWFASLLQLFSMIKS
ncbi:MerR family transcriptional regulator [Bacillus taeanensis]|nr:MerR family transcriptional regulator [Bacillus taeanensis]